MNEPCNLSCSCDGWILPWNVNGSCTSVCGDGLVRGAEQCDDGNLIDHDGCSSSCTNEPCNMSCLCDGWTLPWVYGSCTTICGDGMKRGNEQCDDGNNKTDDYCDNSCLSIVPPYSPNNMNPSLLTSEMSTYPALLIFILGFRIVGL